MLLFALMITVLIVLIVLINKSFKAKNKECYFEFSISFTKGFCLKFNTTNKKDAPSSQD